MKVNLDFCYLLKGYLRGLSCHHEVSTLYKLNHALSVNISDLTADAEQSMPSHQCPGPLFMCS